MIFLDQLLGGLKKRHDTDFIDRINYYYTPMLIVFFGLTLSAKQYVGQPIQCWVPAQFTGAWEQYSEFYCFVQNTYFVPFSAQELPKTYDERENREIGYYQWVPFVLALQAFLFFFPIMIWRLFNWQSGLNVKQLVNSATDIGNYNKDNCDKNVSLVARHIQDSLDIQRDLKPSGQFCGFCCYGKRFGSYVSWLYIFVKLLFIVNVIGQFFILNEFIGSQYRFWGVDVLRDIMNGRSWEESGHFPRVTMCDFKVRTLGNIHNWSIQCVLQINMFNEKIYLFLWWWFLVVAVVTVVNFFYWLTVTVVGSMQRDFVQSYLKVYSDLENQKPPVRRSVEQFVDSHLRSDGVFLLRIISANAGHIVVTALVGALWKLAVEKGRAPPTSSTASPRKGDAGTPVTDISDPGFEENLYDPGKQSPDGKPLLGSKNSV